ncbi:DUF262 domain-containing protein [Brevibacillus sp. NPDC058079]|uniref:DUF262 domain-containing protein n=1 Tax=Brevibacillus sp. NPDC058079 TaxID=3346330 RepID=UPI0036ED2FEE
MKVTTSKIKVEKVLKDQKTKKLSFDMKIQRSEDIWDKKRRSKMIHSMMIKWPTNSIFAAKEGNVLNIIDGKQRLTTALAFISDKFVLDKSTPPIDDLDLQGKKFSELPEELQKNILEYEFDLTTVQEATAEELEEFFFRLNNGMPLRQIETTRAILGGKVLKLVEDVANTPFFQTKANISNIAKKRFTHQELVLQILAMIHKEETGFSGKEMEAFVRELRNQRIQDELKSKMQNASFYLNQAYLQKEKSLRKIHIPTLFKLVLDLQEKALLITPTEFEEWSRTFFENMPEAYIAATQSGSAKKESVQTRYREMKAHFDAYFAKRLTDNVSEGSISEDAS